MYMYIPMCDFCSLSKFLKFKKRQTNIVAKAYFGLFALVLFLPRKKTVFLCWNLPTTKKPRFLSCVAYLLLDTNSSDLFERLSLSSKAIFDLYVFVSTARVKMCRTQHRND